MFDVIFTNRRAHIKENMSTFASQEGRQGSSLRTIIWRRIYVQKEIVGKQRNKNQISAFLFFIYYSVRPRNTLPKRLDEPYNEHLMFTVWLTTNLCYSIIGMIKKIFSAQITYSIGALQLNVITEKVLFRSSFSAAVIITIHIFLCMLSFHKASGMKAE